MLKTMSGDVAGPPEGIVLREVYGLLGGSKELLAGMRAYYGNATSIAGLLDS